MLVGRLRGDRMRGRNECHRQYTMGLKLAVVALGQHTLYWQPHISQRALSPIVTGVSPPAPTVDSRPFPAHNRGGGRSGPLAECV